MIRKKKIPYKACNQGCTYCFKTIPNANKFIYEKNIEIIERRKSQSQIKNQNEISKNEEQNNDINTNISNNIEINLRNEDITKFKIKKVRGDGNCILRAILESVGINENKCYILRDALVQTIEQANIDKDSLNNNGFESKNQLISYVSENGQHLGIEILSILLEKFNIKTNIWLDNKINGMKWIILNDKKDINQPKIYLNFKDYNDVYPDETEIAEKKCSL